MSIFNGIKPLLMRSFTSVTFARRYTIATALLLILTGPQMAIASAARQATLTEAGKETTHYYPAISSSAELKNVLPNQRTRETASLNTNFWVYGVTIGLGTDFDQDGHFSTFNISFDVDTYFNSSSVYAVLYLSNAGGAWTEYAVTGNFTVSGSGPSDRYTLDANLDSGYPSGYYEHYVEIYDAHTHELVSTYGPEDSYSLQELPFESSHHDNDDYYYGGGSVDTSVSLSFSGTGPVGLPSLAVLLLVMLARRKVLR